MTYKKLLYFNALFDLKPGKVQTPALQRAANEMTALFLPMGTKEDFIVLKTVLPQGYREYLSEAGLSLPKPHVESKENTLIVEPWGWDDEALELSLRYGAFTQHPEIPAVLNVNTRKFCASLPDQITQRVPGSVFVEDYAGLKNALKRLEDAGPLVVKPNFGSSGFGFIHIENGNISAAQESAIQSYLKSGGAVIEPWVRRIEDLSCSIEINRNGKLDRISFFRCIVNKRGTFNGVYIPPEDAVLQGSHYVEIKRCVFDAVEYIFAAGYYGPASIDSFVYSDRTGKEQIVAVGEINARHIVSDIGRGIRKQITADKHCYLRFASRKLLRLPDNYGELKEKLGSLCFSPQRGTGVLVVTPLRVGDGSGFYQPYRNAYFLCADSESELFEMDQALFEALRN